MSYDTDTKDSDYQGWRSPLTIAEEAAAERPDVVATPEELAQDFFSKVKTELEAASSLQELNEIHDKTLALYQEQGINEVQYDSFMAAYRERFNVLQLEQEVQMMNQQIQEANNIADLTQLSARIETLLQNELISIEKWLELMSLCETKRAELQQQSFEMYTREIASTSTIDALNNNLSYYEAVCSQGRITEDQLAELKQAAEAKRAELQQKNSEMYAREIASTPTIDTLDNNLKYYESVCSGGRITDEQLSELKQAVEAKRAELQSQPS